MTQDELTDFMKKSKEELYKLKIKDEEIPND